MMNNSILTSIKKLLGITEEYTHFDADITIHINSVFAILHQLGVGPEKGYSIVDAQNTWDELLLDSTTLESVKTYTYLKVRLLFDPPTSSSVLDSMTRTISEFEWRIQVAAESSNTSGEEEGRNG